MQLLLGGFHSRVEVIAVNIAESHKAARVGAGEMEIAAADAAHADDTFGELVARSYKTVAEHFARHDGEKPDGAK